MKIRLLEEFIKYINVLETNLKAKILLAQVYYKISANWHQKHSPVYKINDQI